MATLVLVGKSLQCLQGKGRVGQTGPRKDQIGMSWLISATSLQAGPARDAPASTPHGSQAVPSCWHGSTPHHPYGVSSSCWRCAPRLRWPWEPLHSSVWWHAGVAASLASPRCHMDVASASSPAHSGRCTAWLPAQWGSPGAVRFSQQKASLAWQKCCYSDPPRLAGWTKAEKATGD